MKNLENIARKLDKIWKKVYIVWSFNVHKILNKNFWSDFDLTTPATPDEIRSVLRVVWEIWSKYGTLIVKEWWQSFEITTFRKDIWSINRRKPANVEFCVDLEEDAKRRDFTFNAIYYDILEDKYIDPVWWINDLKNWVIRFVWDIEKRLDEDILRALRYVRLKNKYSLKPAEKIYSQILKNRMNELQNISKERIKQELDKMIIDKSNIGALKDLKNLRFFRSFIPQVDNLSLTPGWKLMHLEWNAWIHTLLSIKALNKMKIKDVDIYWTTLFHDIGKYSTYSFDNFWNVHYFSHELEWANIFHNIISKNLYFSKKSSKKILYLIKNHIRIWNIEQMNKIKAYKFMMNEYFESLIILYNVDNIWKNPPDNDCGSRLQKLFDKFKINFEKTKFIDGNDILKMYPNLKWPMIWAKLRQENDKILKDL